jgi:hypothetical protein
MAETIKPEIVAKAFFRGVQVGMLVKYAGTWNYYGMVPLMDDPRTQKIIQKEKVVI